MRRALLTLVLLLLALPATSQPVIADLDDIASGMSGALGVANPGDGSNRLFVIQQGGSARVVRNDTLLAPAYFTLSSNTQCAITPGGPLTTVGFSSGNERGLLGLAFHPSFETNGFVFISFTDANGDSVIARVTASSPGADVLTPDFGTCLVILRVDQDYANHNGGNILFGPDGFLYFGLGDGGSGGDPCNRGQTLDPAALRNSNPSDCAVDAPFTAHGGNPDSRALLGKLVRINVDATTPAGSTGLCGARADGSANYAVPPGNPFTATPACDETYAYGLRNPWRWSFDRANGDFIVGDVGQDRWEEVSLSSSAALPGRNFDWNVCEARHLQGSCTSLCDSLAASEVIIEYENFPQPGSECNAGTRQGCSVTGGYRYRGPDSRFTGLYFYGDACRSELRWSSESGGTWTGSTDASTLPGLGGPILGFGEDDSGVVYFVAGGTLYRIGIADVLFSNGFE